MNMNNLLDEIITGQIQIGAQASIFKKAFEIIEESSKIQIEKMIKMKNFLTSEEEVQSQDNNFGSLLKKKRRLRDEQPEGETRIKTRNIQWVEYDKRGRKKKNKGIILDHAFKYNFASTNSSKRSLYYCEYRKRGCKHAVTLKEGSFLSEEGVHSFHPSLLPSIDEYVSDDMDVSDD